MPRYIAFLRAVNVGGRTVTMPRLRGIFEDLGFTAVETFIASGNVIFEAAGPARSLEATIEAGLERALRFPVATFLRTPLEIGSAVSDTPFPDETPGGLYVGFTARRLPPAAAERMARLETEVDKFAVRGRELYWRGLAGMGQSRVTGAAIEKALGGAVTFRSMTTVRKLALKYGAPSLQPRRPAP